MLLHNCLMVVFLTTVAAMPRPPNGIRVPRSAPAKLGNLDVAKYLHKYGHMSKSKMTKVGELATFDEESMRASIRSFQKLSGIKATGKLDDTTLQYMSLPRCGVEDTVGAITVDTGGHKAHSKFVTRGKGKKRGRKQKGQGKKKGGKGGKSKKEKENKRVKNKENVARSRQKRYNVQGSQWDKKVMTYKILNYTPDMDKSHVNSAIRKALQVWAEHTPLKFKPVDSNNADIKISFGKGSHGDSYPFDGKGGTLAHAFFPQSGQAHFDDDEYFSHKGEGTNLLIVAAHEFGHSLGLGHSSVSDSLMAPFYQGYVEDFKLHPDDIAGIQRIYGKNVDKTVERKKRPTPRPSRTTTTVAPRTTKKPRLAVPNVCSTHLDAMIELGRRRYATHAFKGSYYYRLDDEKIMPGYPRKIGNRWRGLPGNLNAAAYSDRTGLSYFFKGSKVYLYRGNTPVQGFPKNAIDMGLPSHPVAALAWGGTGNIYIFKKKNFYTFYELTGRVIGPQPIRSFWGGIPEDIDAALTWNRNRKTYFIKGNDYYRVNDYTRRADRDYPKNMNENWLGCKRSSKSSRIRSKPKSRPQILARLIAKPTNTSSIN